MSKLHTSFASSELPRPVASFFVLLSCWLLISEKDLYRNGALAAVSLAIGAALRFSEVIFIVPAILFLAVRKHWRQAFVLGLVFTVSLIVILGLGDALYWKSPWYSLKNIVDYTLVKKLSSRGYESPFFYLMSIGIWSNFLTVGLSCFALRLKNRGLSFWAFSPLLMLSFLPHKEPRYLVPTIPFIAMMAGLSAWHFLEKNRGTGFVMYLPRKLARPFLALSVFAFGTVLLSSKDVRFAYVAIPVLVLLMVLYLKVRTRLRSGGAGEAPGASRVRWSFLLILTVLAMGALEIDGFRLRRTESGVEMARFLAHRPDLQRVAIEDAWKAGGRLYLWNCDTIMNIDETLLLRPEQLIQEVKNGDIQAIGLTDARVRGLKYDDLLRLHGYKEVSFAKEKRLHRYRLFIRGSFLPEARRPSLFSLTSPSKLQ